MEGDRVNHSLYLPISGGYGQLGGYDVHTCDLDLHGGSDDDEE